MICPTCRYANTAGVACCAHCGSALPLSTNRSPYGGDQDPWTGHGSSASASAGEPAGALRPDWIYNPDGSVALGPPSRLSARVSTGTLGTLPRAGRGLLPAPLAALLAKPYSVTLLSMALSIFVYSVVWGLDWTFALGFVVLLFVHEMGHFVVMKMKHVASSPPVFVPFIGAVIGMRTMPRNVLDEAIIGIAGPIAGTIAALGVLIVGASAGGEWTSLALVGLFLNLFNLLPVSPLDGGRIAAAVSRRLWPVGLILLACLLVVWHNPFLLLVGLIGGLETVARMRGRHRPTAGPGYYAISLRSRVVMGTLYAGLIAVIVVAMSSNSFLMAQLFG